MTDDYVPVITRIDNEHHHPRPHLERLIYSDEATLKIGCSFSVLQRYVKRGNLAPPRVVGGRVAWTEEELVRFVDALPREHPRGRGRPRGSFKNRAK